jgi:hypothetical protein
MNVLRIRLDEEDVKCLIGGGCLTIKIPDEPDKVLLYMADIGFHNIDKMMNDVEFKKVEPYLDFERLNKVGWQNAD